MELQGEEVKVQWRRVEVFEFFYMLFKYIEKIENDGSVLKYFRCINGFHCDICEAAVRKSFSEKQQALDQLYGRYFHTHKYISIHIRWEEPCIVLEGYAIYTVVVHCSTLAMVHNNFPSPLTLVSHLCPAGITREPSWQHSAVSITVFYNYLRCPWQTAILNAPESERISPRSTIFYSIFMLLD